MAYFLFLGQFFYYTKGVQSNIILLLGYKNEKRSRISYICRNVVFTFSKIVLTFLESNSYISQRFSCFYKGFPTLLYKERKEEREKMREVMDKKKVAYSNHEEKRKSFL